MEEGWRDRGDMTDWVGGGGWRNKVIPLIGWVKKGWRNRGDLADWVGGGRGA